MNLDDELRRALRREPAPPGLGDAVLARLPRGSEPQPGERPWRRWLAAAAVLTLVASGGTRYYVHQRTLAEAERVKAEIRVALQITSEKLALVHRMVQDGPGAGPAEAGTYEPVER